MNIIIVNDYCAVNGGSDKVAVVSAEELSKRGHNVTYFGAVAPICSELLNSKVNMVCLNQQDLWKGKNKAKAFMSGIWNKKAKKDFSTLLDYYDSSDTIIHFHGLTKALTFSVIEAALEKNFKIVFTLHDYFTFCPNGAYYNYRTEKICSYKPLSAQCSTCNCDSKHYYYKIWRLIRHRKIAREGLVADKIKNYIYISETSRKILKPYLCENADFYYVKNPIDIEKEPAVNVRNNNSFVYIGRLSKEKGCVLFAEAAKELNLNAVFVGDGQLREQIKDIYPEAVITGWVDSEAVKKQLQNARALIFPSLWYETLGLTVLEAQAKGVPAIISNTCTATEFVEEHEAGLWFNTGDIQDLKEKIKIMLEDETAEAYGRNAYESYWKNDFTTENHVNQLLKVYEHILERG